MREVRLGKLAGLEMTAVPSAAAGSALLWLLLSALGSLLPLPFTDGGTLRRWWGKTQ